MTGSNKRLISTWPYYVVLTSCQIVYYNIVLTYFIQMEFWFVYPDSQCEKQNLHFMLRCLSVSCTSLYYSLSRVSVCRKDFTWMIIIMCVHNTQNNNLLLTANITLSALVLPYLIPPMQLFYCTIVQCAVLRGVHNITLQAGSTHFKNICIIY